MPRTVAGAAARGTPIRRSSLLASVGAASLAAAVACFPLARPSRSADDVPWDRAKEYGAVSVRDRPRTDFGPDGIHVGNFLVFPELGFQTSFTRDPGARRAQDWKYDLTAALEARSMLPRHMLNITLEGRATAHSEPSDLRYLDGRARIEGRYDIDHATNLFGRASSELVHEENVDEERPAGTSRPTPVLVQRAEAGIWRSMGRIDASVGARYARFDYGNVKTNSGLSISQSYRNSWSVEPYATVGYRFSPGYRAFAEVSASHIDNQGDGIFDRDANAVKASAGLAFELSPLVKVLLKGGYTRQDFSEPTLTDFGAFTYEARLDWYVSPLVTIGFNTRRDVSETSYADAAARISTSYSVRTDYEMWRNLLLNAEATLKYTDYIGNARTDRTFIARVGAEYMASKHWRFTMGYEHQELDSSVNEYDRRFDRVMVGAKYRF